MTPPGTPPGAPLDPTLDRMDYGRALKRELLMNEKVGPWIPYAQPLLDAVMMFEELDIGYALVGGVAAMYFGRARFTEDLDFVAVTGHMEVLSAHPDVMEKYHFDPACTWKLLHQSGVQIDIWKDEHAEAIIGRSQPIELAGQAVRVADAHDLIAMKLRSHRLKDDYDIAQIATSTPIDPDTVRLLVNDEQFAAFQKILKRA